jgi:hypothetical protein
MTLAEAPATLRTAVEATLENEPTQIQQAELTASGGASGDEFGYTVALSSTIAVVGAPDGNSGTGAAYVFVSSGTTWSQQAELVAADGASGNEFGYSVAISGTTVVVGADEGNARKGAAYVFVGSGSSWAQQAELTAPDGTASDHFGRSVAISGTTVVVGAPFNNSETGAVYLFVGSGSSWSLQQELTGGASGDYFGDAVAISGTTLVVAAPEQNSEAGAAYVFVGSGTTWSQQAELVAADGASGNEFGYSVAISGTTVVVGAPYRSSDTGGAAYVFVGSGSSWPQEAELIASDGASGNEFGYSVTISGTIAVVGAPKSSDAGVAYPYVGAGSSWYQEVELTASDGAAGDNFGYSVATSGAATLMGADARDASTGAAYVFGPPSSPVSLGATPIGTPHPISWGPNFEDVFWRGTDNNLWHMYEIDGTWYGPQQLTSSGNLASDPEPVSWGLGNLEVFWTGTDGNLWQMYYLNGWHGPESLGDGPLGKATPMPVSWGVGNLEVFWEGTDQNLWEAYYSNGWHGPQGLGDGPLGPGNTPAPASWGVGNIEVFWKGTDQNLWEAYYANGWHGPVGLGDGPLGSDPQPVASQPGVLDVFWEGTDQGLWHAWYVDGWNGPQSLPGKPLGSAPTVTSWGGGRVDVFWVGTDGNLWHDWYQDGWSGPQGLGGGPLDSLPEPVTWGTPGYIDILWTGPSSTLCHVSYN